MELLKIEQKIQRYSQEKEALENLMEVIDDSSQYSGEMLKSREGKEHLLESLKERRRELLSLDRLSDENERDIDNLANELSVMYRQKSALHRKMGKLPDLSLNDKSWGNRYTNSQRKKNRTTFQKEKKRRRGGSWQDLPSIKEEELRIQALDEQISKLQGERAAAQERIRGNVPQYLDLDGSNHTSSISATSALRNQLESHDRYHHSYMNDEPHMNSSSRMKDDEPKAFKMASVRRSKRRFHVLDQAESKYKQSVITSETLSGRSNPHSLTFKTDGNYVSNAAPQYGIIPSLIVDEREPMMNKASENVICESLNGIADFFRVVLGLKEPQSAVSWKW